MRIGFFSPTINRVGGGEWVTLNMIHALKAKNHKIVIYSAEKIDPIHIQRFFGHNLYFDEVNQWPSIFDPYNLESIYPNCLKSFLFRVKCDLLIDTFSNDLLPWTDAVYFQGESRVASHLPKGVKGLFFLPYKALLTHTNRHVRPEEKILMTCSKWSAERIEKTAGLHINVLYPPISDFFKVKDINNQPKSDVITAVIRISRDKRPETIPRIAKLVSNDVPFVIIGSCKHEHELNALNNLRESIRKLGMDKKVKVLLNVSRERHREILKRSKIYLHPFSIESFGISIVEAMSAGCVPVVPDCGGPREFVPKQFRYADLEEAASIIDASIANWSPRKALEFVNNADRFSQARFSKEFLKLMKL